MMNVCPICGRYHCIHWPEHWVYRRGETYYCSAMCMDVDIVRDMNLLKQVRMERRKRKMARYKKDGTPAKKPGPRAKKPEIPEPVSGGEWEKMETPETMVIEAAKVNMSDRSTDFENWMTDYKVRCIETEFGLFFYDRKHDVMTWTTEEGEEVSMDPTHWRIVARKMPEVLRILGAVK